MDPEPPRPGRADSASLSGVAASRADVRAPMRLGARATARDATMLRHRLDAWLEVDVPVPLIEDIVPAVYEALANVAEHAYAHHEGPGAMRLAAHRTAGHVSVTVVDHGVWRAPIRAPFRGRGLAMMQLLVPSVNLIRSTDGTLVHFRVPV